MARLIGVAVIIFILVIAGYQCTYVVEPGHRGVLVTLGKVSPQFLPEGFGIKPPFISSVHQILVRQQTQNVKADCYSMNLQQVKTEMRILYRIPQESVVKIFRDYYGEPFQSLIAPRVHEALKEVIALQSAEMIVQNREQIKSQALEVAKKKVGEILQIVDLVVQDISLSPELEQAIEQKMVQEQEAKKAEFRQQRAEIEARTAVIEARGIAESIRIRGEALRRNPTFIDLQVVEGWDGVSPLVIGGEATGAQMLLPLRPLKPGAEANAAGQQ